MIANNNNYLLILVYVCVSERKEIMEKLSSEHVKHETNS